MTRPRSLSRDRAGVTAVEFSVILPGMLMLICGSLELGHMILARSVLEGAVVDAARTATASLETAEAERTGVMRARIIEMMAPFPLAPDEAVTIETKVYADFASVTPETFTDSNKNGRHDLGENFTDRNANGRWDAAAPKAGTLGGPGDVVSYSALFPKRILFDFLAEPLGLGSNITLSATTVVRNESVVRRSAT